MESKFEFAMLNEMSSSFLSTGLWRAGVPVFLECEGPFLAPQSFRLHLLCDVGVVAEIMVVTFVAVADFSGSTAEVFILRRSERSCVSVRLQMVEGHCSCSGAPTGCRHVGEVQPCSAASWHKQKETKPRSNPITGIMFLVPGQLSAVCHMFIQGKGAITELANQDGENRKY